jgi:hypothetical protein
MNEELSEELAQVRDALQLVAVSVSNLVPRGELDRASDAVVEDNRRWRRSVALLVIGGPVLFVLTLGVGVRNEVVRHRESRSLQNGVRCLLADLDDHRHTNQYAHEALADAAKIQIEQPDVIPLTKDQAAKLKMACATYIEGAAGRAQPAAADYAGGGK